MRTTIRIKKAISKKVRTKLGITKIIFIDRCALIFMQSFYIILYNQKYKQKMTDIMKEKENPLIEESKRINSKPK